MRSGRHIEGRGRLVDGQQRVGDLQVEKRVLQNTKVQLAHSGHAQWLVFEINVLRLFEYLLYSVDTRLSLHA